MDKEKKEKIALFRFGVISRLLWVKEDERQQEALLREITSTAWEIPFSNRTALGRSTVLEWLKKYREKRKRGRWFKYNLTLKKRGSRIRAYAETSET